MGGLADLLGLKPKMPKVEAPTPLPDEEALTTARRRMVVRENSGAGATGTNLTAGSRETLGP